MCTVRPDLTHPYPPHPHNRLLQAWDASTLSPDVLLDVEADCYWCLCKLLDGIQVRPTPAQLPLRCLSVPWRLLAPWLAGLLVPAPACHPLGPREGQLAAAPAAVPCPPYLPQDHYTYAQPGIQRTVFHVRELVG